MKKLHKYETPLSDHECGYFDIDTAVSYLFASDLERKLALAVDMLSKLTIDGIAEYEMREAMHTGVYVGGGLFREAVKTLEALRVIENENPQG